MNRLRLVSCVHMLRQRLSPATALAAITALFVGPAAAQIPSNASIQGAYNVRYLGVNVDQMNPADEALSFSGTFTFDGKGGFTNVKRVTFSVGDHGPFTKDYAPPNDTAANIKADISAQVAELQSINELAS